MELSLFTQAVALSALAVVGVQQFLKFKFIPVSFANKYPVPTNIILSVLASIVAVWQSNTVKPAEWTDWLVLVALVSVTAAITYNQLIGRWAELKSTEGEG